MKLTLNPHLDSEITILTALKLSKDLREHSIQKIKKLKRKFIDHLKKRKAILNETLEKKFITTLEKIKEEVIKEIHSLRKASEVEIQQRACALSYKILTRYSHDDPKIIQHRIEALLQRVVTQSDISLLLSQETKASLDALHTTLTYPVKVLQEMNPGDITVLTPHGSMSLFFKLELENAC